MSIHTNAELCRFAARARRDFSVAPMSDPRWRRQFGALLALALFLPGPARAAPSPVAGLPLPGCAEVRAAALFDSALVTAFETRYPRALVGEASVERLDLDPGQVENAAAYLACVAGLTGLDVFVAEQGLALFASRRHGRAALAALDRIARGTGPEARGARDYARQIRAYLRGPGR
ncbi:hypothetical protein [Methylobacterium sp. SyP6R]|uniref:hypothetical protein n=1 Tax=Methylobacterium sp. SyP6R TaxID=2718876 RepID=UPI001F48A5A2|nr:hypothetical protein [Methylobacterium sp. SyP6R]MCF4129589.1 hypothetical protein [Methylobacterium sp. SyP6R]